MNRERHIDEERMFTRQQLGPGPRLQAPGADHLHLEAALAVAQGELDVAESRRGEHLAPDELAGTEALDEFGERSAARRFGRQARQSHPSVETIRQ